MLRRVPRKVVRGEYNEFWEPVLGFRSTGQHARCSTCARPVKTRRDHPDAAERAHADSEYTQHMRRVFAMRRVDARFSDLIKHVLRAWLHVPEPMPARAH